ncbi:putative ORFan [Tupanvirus deep ocean]|uniref:ORFan n=2 Tax=Tupanvirus TaxID=2094720 RepID=A0AC62A6X6_9VIRU|nr:putative ORFan [Tupanvirus deep ocean]QKU33486.1 putative ORFan [Tupanvirus deep ocean]
MDNSDFYAIFNNPSTNVSCVKTNTQKQEYKNIITCTDYKHRYSVFNEMELKLKLYTDTLSFAQIICDDNIVEEYNKNNNLFFAIMNSTNCASNKFKKIVFTAPSENSELIDNTKFVINKGAMYLDTNEKIVIPSNYYNLYVHLKNNYTAHFIFIDTNLFAYKKLENRYEYLDAKESLYNMFKWLKYILKNNKSDILFFVGHESIFDINKNTLFPKVGIFFDIILNFIINNNYRGKIYYLCSGNKCFEYICFKGEGRYDKLEINQFSIGNVNNDMVLQNEFVEYYDQKNNKIGTAFIYEKDNNIGYLQYVINSLHNNINIVYAILP